MFSLLETPAFVQIVTPTTTPAFVAPVAVETTPDDDDMDDARWDEMAGESLALDRLTAGCLI